MLAPLTSGPGIVFTLHHVLPDPPELFAPNGLLCVSPDFLDRVIVAVRAAGYEFVTIDEAWSRVCDGRTERFCALTFDDGYRDFRDFAMPVLQRHDVPAALFVTTGFADGTADLWWEVLERSLAKLEHASIDLGSGPEALDLSTATAKSEAWRQMFPRLRALPEPRMRGVIGGLAVAAGIDSLALTRSECLDWDELAIVAADPLVTIGVHTKNHYMLAKWPDDVVIEELTDSRAEIRQRLGVAADHLAYPVGTPIAAGLREFEIAKELGFKAAWTTRPGHLFAEHSQHATALPRVSLNGNFQEDRYIDLFLSGTPFAFWNRFRRVNSV